jgi:hypothetical protein
MKSTSLRPPFDSVCAYFAGQASAMLPRTMQRDWQARYQSRPRSSSGSPLVVPAFKPEQGRFGQLSYMRTTQTRGSGILWDI